jgi:hypothetical protein
MAAKLKPIVSTIKMGKNSTLVMDMPALFLSEFYLAES